METVTKDMLIGDILKMDMGIAPILMDVGMHCLGCPSSQMESLDEACCVHGKDTDQIVEKINSYLSSK